MSRWGPEGPPEEAYSRFTEPERFLPLHHAALELVARLEREHAPERREGVPLPGPLAAVTLARPAVRLVPAAPGRAPLLFALTAVPSVLVLAGRTLYEAFPWCGCDACDPSVEEEARRMAWLVEDVVAGRFREEIRVPLLGRTRARAEHWGDGGRSGRENSHWLPAELPRRGGRTVLDWLPWPRRGAAA